MWRNAGMLVLLAVLSGTAVAQITTMPSDTPELKAMREAVAKAVAASMKDLTSDSPSRREAAQRKLACLSESVMAEVLDQCKLADLEQSQRAAALFDSLEVSARMGKMLLSLPPAERAVAVELANERPREFSLLFSGDDASAAGAVAALGVKGAGGDAVILWALSQPNWPMRNAAIAAATAKTKLSDPLKEALYARLDKLKAESNPRNIAMENSQIYYSSRQTASQERGLLLNALMNFKDDRVVPYLLSSLMTNDYQPFDSGTHDVIGMVRQIKDQRCVPALMGLIGNDQVITNANINGKNLVVKRGDLILAIVVEQSGQKLADYDFFNDQNYPNLFGFESDAKRNAARSKMRQWWTEHEQDYKDVPRITLSKKTIAAEVTPVSGLINRVHVNHP